MNYIWFIIMLIHHDKKNLWVATQSLLLRMNILTNEGTLLWKHCVGNMCRGSHKSIAAMTGNEEQAPNSVDLLKGTNGQDKSKKMIHSASFTRARTWSTQLAFIFCRKITKEQATRQNLTGWRRSSPSTTEQKILFVLQSSLKSAVPA